ncbi:MAG: L-histidine N(alpha)-methyltransferase [Rhodothermales bacterium]|nr:L-histidine N(alpha)-methyltransferase [Rhodothermales bacterium]
MSSATDCLEVGTAQASLHSDVISGLSQPQKTIPSKYFYDERGSQLFDEITTLPEYYPTRTEEAIMRKFAPDIINLIGPDALLIELGSGSSTKTRILLDRLTTLKAYVPIDISSEFLEATAERLRDRYPHLTIRPLAEDYTKELWLPTEGLSYDRKVAFYPGSTIGNFDPDDARDFMRRVRVMVGDKGGFLIGVDLVKDPRILEAAYNDSKGVTAEFNLNLLNRINRELDANFDLTAFEHRAVYNEQESRIEMHLVSTIEQLVSVGNSEFEFAEGEYIYTESSYKYTVDDFASMAEAAGFRLTHTWTDDARLFSTHFLDSNL